METTRNDYLVSKKFYRYLIPSFLSEMAMHMGSVVDAVIVGNLIGVDALSAVTLASPIIQVLHLPGLILGLGGSTLAAIWLGERKLNDAFDMFSACVIAGIIFSFTGVLTAFWINAPLAHLVVDDPKLVTFVEEYLFINLLGLPIMTLTFLTCEFLSVDNHPDLGAWMFSIAEAVNIVFDIVLVMSKILTLSGILISTLTVVFWIFPEEIASLFGMENEELLPTAAVCLQIYSLSFVLYVFNEFLQTYYQTILETFLATLDTILEFFVLLIPITFLLISFARRSAMDFANSRHQVGRKKFCDTSSLQIGIEQSGRSC